jgi:hypothetical protein
VNWRSLRLRLRPVSRRGRRDTAARREYPALWGCGHTPEGHRESSKSKAHRRAARSARSSEQLPSSVRSVTAGLSDGLAPWVILSARAAGQPWLFGRGWSRFALAQSFTMDHGGTRGRFSRVSHLSKLLPVRERHYLRPRPASVWPWRRSRQFPARQASDFDHRRTDENMVAPHEG